MLRSRSQLLLWLFRLADVGLVLLAWVGGYGIRLLGDWLGWSHFPVPPVKDFTFLVILTGVLTPMVFAWQRAYAPRRTQPLARELALAVRCAGIVWLAMYLFSTLVARLLLSRLLLVGMFVSWVALLTAERLAVRGLLRWARRRGYNQRHAAIVGTGRIAQRLYWTLRNEPWMGIRVAYFAAPSPRRATLCGLPVRDLAGGVEALLEGHPVDMVFLALPAREASWTGQLLDQVHRTPLQVAVVPDLPSPGLLRQSLIELDDLQIFVLTSSPMFDWPGAVKRLIDVVGAVAGLVLLSPVVGGVALLVKRTSPGPVIYRQQRCSIGCQPFVLYKFRSMRTDAEDDTGPVWSSTDDPRVTPVGRFLRRFNLDELPQLWNVLIGDMSLVGPRPERPGLIAGFRDAIPRYMLRSHVKAGLTGWAQVHGYRGDTQLRKRIQYDLHYISHWSLALDAWIILWTAVQCFIPSFLRRTAKTRSRS